MYREFILGLAALMLAGCNVSVKGDGGGGGGPAPKPPLVFKDQVGQGQINGHKWAFASGRARFVQFQQGQNKLEVELWSDAQEGDACQRQAPSDYSVRLYSGTDIKAYPVSSQAVDTALVMSDSTHPGRPEQNIVAAEGVIEITDFTPVRVRGRMMGRFDGGSIGIGPSEVNGNFDVPFCR